MASNFPTSLDTFTNPTSADALDSVSVPHATQHSDLNDAVEALEAKVGVNSSAVSSSHDYKIAQRKILQVVSTTKTDTFTTTSASYVDITGLSVAITPSSASSKVLVIATIEAGTNADAGLGVLQLVRGATAVAIGDTASNRIRATTSVASSTNAVTNGYGISHLDSPATTSATTYKIQGAFIGGSGGIFINRSSDDTDANYRARLSSTITAFEVSA